MPATTKRKTTKGTGKMSGATKAQMKMVQQMFTKNRRASVTKREPLKTRVRSNTSASVKAAATEKISSRAKKRRRTSSSPSLQTEDDESRIRVVARCRPQIPEDLDHCIDEDEPVQCVHISSTRDALTVTRPCYEDRTFRFDSVLGPKSTQNEMYRSIGQRAVEEVMDGFNGTVITYGQTGSGKTYTVFGSSAFWNRIERTNRAAETDRTTENDDALESWTEWSQAGLLPRAYAHMAKLIAKRRQEGATVALRFSALQIYQEQLTDLLCDIDAEAKSCMARPAFDLSLTAKKSTAATSSVRNLGEKILSIRESKKDGIYVEGLRWRPVASVRELLELTSKINKRRSTQHTMQNRTSSRSHCLIQVAVEQRLTERIFNDEAATASASESTTHQKKTLRSVLLVVDLAGSERVAKSGSHGQRLREAIKINKSISALGNCVAALASGPNTTHVPFRDSKLTRLLTHKLGGNSKVALCTNVCPISGHCEETVSSLSFASRAMRVRTVATINEELASSDTTTAASGGGGSSTFASASSAVVNDLRRENEILKEQIRKLRASCTASATTSQAARSVLWDELIERNARLEIENAQLLAGSNSPGSECVRELQTQIATLSFELERAEESLRLERSQARELRDALSKVSHSAAAAIRKVGE
eukprot:g825.t1